MGADNRNAMKGNALSKRYIVFKAFNTRKCQPPKLLSVEKIFSWISQIHVIFK
jgi:hypothetical protein